MQKEDYRKYSFKGQSKPFLMIVSTKQLFGAVRKLMIIG